MPEHGGTTGALPDADALGLPMRALYEGSVIGDYALRTGLASVLLGAMAPPALLRGGFRQERKRLEFYAALADQHDASKVFSPPERVDIRVTPGHGPGVPGGRVELLRFDSPYVALNPELRLAYARHANNKVARAQHWRHDSGPRPTLAVIHGFGASPAWLNTAFFSLREFFADGWDVVLFTLPFHGSRRGRSMLPLNGVELFAPGMAHFSEGLIHAVHDFRALLDHLFDQGVPRVGVTGLSLGGYTSALLAAVDDRLDFAIPNAAVTWLPQLMHEWFPLNAGARLLQTIAGIGEQEFVRGMAVTSPLTYAPVIPKDRLMVVAGLGDRLAPPQQSMLLWEHWDRPELHWFWGSHVLHFGRGAYLEGMRRLMLTPRSTSAPA